METKEKKQTNGPFDEIIIEKPKEFKKTFFKLIRSMSEYRNRLLVILILAIAGTIFGILGPRLLGDAITVLYDGVISKINGGPGVNFKTIRNVLLILLGLYIFSSTLLYIQGIIMAKLSQKFAYKLRRQVSEKLHKLPMPYFDSKTHGETISIITNDIDTIGQNLNQSLIEVVTGFVTVVGIVVMMFLIDVSITILALIIVPLSILATTVVIKKSQKHFENQQKFLAEVNGHVEEMYSGHNVIKAFNAEDKMLDKFAEANNKLANSAWRSQFLSGLLHPIMIFVGNIGYVLIVFIGAKKAISGDITVGNIQSLISYSKNLTRPIAQVAEEIGMVQSMVAAAERVFAFLEEDEEETIADRKKLDLTKVKGKVDFNKVSFGYNKDKPIINNFNANIKAGQKIAIVGPTGAGKTTLVKLLMRFYDLNSGSILIDDQKMEVFDKKEYRQMFGMVLQDVWLFNGTIMDNLRYGNLKASDEEVIEAAKQIGVDDFIRTLPNGYQMELNEDTNNISLGQKQLLAIVRVILADSKILILDEATSSVDTRTEILIQKAMDKIVQGRTSFIIAHRLSTIKNADLILVINNGNIIEQGSHRELLNKKGFYAELYNSQFEKIS